MTTSTTCSGRQDICRAPARELETKVILKTLIEAKSSLAALNEACQLVPNPAVLINAIPLLEAQSSSEIENIVTTTDELFRWADYSEDLEDTSPVKETLKYRAALYNGYRSLKDRPLSVGTAIEVCSIIKAEPARLRDLPGTKIANPSSRAIVSTPPEGADVIRQKLSNWERFLHDHENLDPLTRMAIAHYQFEAIHPFFDGNGRTGRILNILALVQFDLLKLPVLYLSKYIIDNKADYYRLLTEVTSNGAWEEWLQFMLTAVAETSEWTRTRIHAIKDLQLKITMRIKLDLPNIYRRELVELLFEQPYCRIENVVSAGLATRQTASNWLKALAEAEMLTEVRVGRNKVFVNHAFFDLLTNRA